MTAFILNIVYNKIDLHILINSHNNSFFDSFFKYWTYLGDGIFAVIFVLFLLFLKYRWAIISGISLIITALIVQITKHTIYAGSFRPVLYFKTNYKGNFQLHLISGAEPANYFSFPSGHTATAFAIFFFAALISKNNIMKLIFFIFALLVGYSRIYLSWHFMNDALAGSFVGIIATAVSYLFIVKYKGQILDKSLLNNRKK